MGEPGAADRQLDLMWMNRALGLARRAQDHGEVPVGAVVVAGGKVVGEGFNNTISASDPTAHAEIVALRCAAAVRRNYRLPGTTIYVTLEPCAMCAGAIVQARVGRVVFGAYDDRAGAAGSVMDVLNCAALNHRCAVKGGVLLESSARLLKEFFHARRAR